MDDLRRVNRVCEVSSCAVRWFLKSKGNDGVSRKKLFEI